jgi:molybdate transport system substrate-binding protein
MPSPLRPIYGALTGVALLLAALRPGLAAAPDVIVYCDPTLVPAVRDVGQLFTARSQATVDVFTAPPPLMLAQLARQVQNDALITQTAWMDRAEASGLLKPGTRTGSWRNSLVIAGKSGGAKTDGVFARTDPTPAATIDGPAILTALALQPAHVIGAANSGGVAFLLDTGVAQQGLLHLTDVRANPGLAVLQPVPDGAYPPIVYVAALTKLTQSVNAQAFLDFLHTPEANSRLHAAGLETVP